MRWGRREHSGDEYDAGYEARAAEGQDVHGEATFVRRFGPTAVLDAGCGTGRVARELARWGVLTVGVDSDPAMLATAERKAPHLAWRLADIAVVDVGRQFDVVLLAGNVMLFAEAGSEAAVLANMARHLRPHGVVIAGFQLTTGLTIDVYNQMAADAGLRWIEQWSTWAGEAWRPGDDYVVVVHRLADSEEVS